MIFGKKRIKVVPRRRLSVITWQHVSNDRDRSQAFIKFMSADMVSR